MDKYDIAVAYLKANPDKIHQNWADPEGLRPQDNVASCLFRFVAADDWQHKPHRRGQDGILGCITQIKANPNICKADTEELTQLIANDPRIPSDIMKVVANPELLDIFPEINRVIDQKLNRK